MTAYEFLVLYKGLIFYKGSIYAFDPYPGLWASFQPAFEPKRSIFYLWDFDVPLNEYECASFKAALSKVLNDFGFPADEVMDVLRFEELGEQPPLEKYKNLSVRELFLELNVDINNFLSSPEASRVDIEKVKEQFTKKTKTIEIPASTQEVTYYE